jgi:hypothetical protein
MHIYVNNNMHTCKYNCTKRIVCSALFCFLPESGTVYRVQLYSSVPIYNERTVQLYCMTCYAYNVSSSEQIQSRESSNERRFPEVLLVRVHRRWMLVTVSSPAQARIQS